MPNHQILKAAAEQRRSRHEVAQRTYHQHRAEVPRLIRQLAGPTQADHDRAFDLLSRMGIAIVSELLAALTDPTLDPVAADEVVSLLGVTGDERAREPIWQFFQAHRHNPERVSSAALSLSALGDDRVLLYLRDALQSSEAEIVANAVAGMIFLGELEDVHRLRDVHRRYRTDQEIRTGVANAVLAILGETDQRTFESAMDDIQYSFADQDLWADLWALLDEQFGQGRPIVH